MFNAKFDIRDIVSAIGTLFQKDDAKMRGCVQWHAVDAQGAKVEGFDGRVDNLVVDAGKALAASRLCANTNAAITHLGVGTGTTAVAAGQTALITQTARPAVDSATNSANVATVVATVPAGTATGTIEEIGLFNASSAGTMIARALTGTITKPAGLGLVFTWTITVG